MSTERPTQAVILAGGLGTRLRPLTDTRPKPMIEFHGKPFLEYLLEMVREQGFQRVLLLLGYLPQVIQDYFGDGRRVGLQIEYAVSDVEHETGRRLKLAASRLDPVFLFMYCDNYWPMRFDRMWAHYTASGAQGLLSVYDNADNATRDNVRVDGQGWVTAYDKDRLAPGLKGVDIGFGIFRREVADVLSDENVSFERVAYAHLLAQKQLQAFVSPHRYYSISSVERLPLTERFLARQPAIILDRDGVLNRRPPKAEYVKSWADWHWLPGALEALRLLRQAGYRVALVSNQAGIARGVMSEADLRAVHERMLAEICQAGGAIDAIYHCPHGWDSPCACRKPRPGMLLQAQKEFHLDLSRTYFLGDDERDGQAAEAAGCHWLQVTEQRTVLDRVREVLSLQGHGPRGGSPTASSAGSSPAPVTATPATPSPQTIRPIVHPSTPAIGGSAA